MLRSIARKFLTSACFIFWFWVFAVPLLALIGIKMAIPPLSLPIEVIALPLVLAWPFASFYLALRTIHHMFECNRFFLESARHALIDLRFHLAFLPVVGRWIQPANSTDDD